jgi:hypothetical protein
MKLRDVAAWCLSFGFSTLLTACGGKDSDAAPPVSAGDWSNKLVAAYCSGFGSCCASKGFAFNATACDANLSGLLTSNSFPPPTCNYNAQAAANCLAGLQAELSSCSTSANTASDCDRVCDGTLAPGAACNDGVCAKADNGTVLCTPSSTSGTTPVCVVFVHAKASDPCQATCGMLTSPSGPPQLICHYLNSLPAASGTASCFGTDGLYCSTDGICQPLAALGANCSATSTCVDDAYCSRAQICVAKKAGGTSCQSTDECSGFCDSNTQRCADSNPTGLYISPTSANCSNPTGS